MQLYFYHGVIGIDIYCFILNRIGLFLYGSWLLYTMYSSVTQK